MSNRKMLALVAIMAGALFTGACADDVTGPLDPQVVDVPGEALHLGPEAPAPRAPGEWPDEPRADKEEEAKAPTTPAEWPR